MIIGTDKIVNLAFFHGDFGFLREPQNTEKNWATTPWFDKQKCGRNSIVYIKNIVP